MSSTTTPDNGTPAWGTRRGPTVPYIPGLDGLRALAVIAVIAYHADSRWLGGGFLGLFDRGVSGRLRSGGLVRREREQRERSGCGGIGEEHGACESGETDGLADGAELDHGEPPGCSLVAGAAGSVQSRLKIFKG